MKNWILLGILVIIKFPTLAQGSKVGYSPFQILVIHPDDVKIDELMTPFSDSIEKEYINRYYNTIKSYEKLKADLPDDKEKERIDAEIKSIELREMEVYDFRYYYSISDLILFDLRILFTTHWENDFSQKEPTLTGYTIESSELFSRDFDKLVKYYQVDYILTFENVHTEKLADTISSIALKFKAILYSSKKGKIVLKEDFSGNSQLNDYKYLTEIYSSHNKNERALEKSVDCDNYLNCLFRSATRFTTERLYEVISKIQKK